MYRGSRQRCPSKSDPLAGKVGSHREVHFSTIGQAPGAAEKPGLPRLLHLRVTQRSNAPDTESPNRNIRSGAYRTDINPVAVADVAHVGPHRELAADPRWCRHNLLLAAINRE